MLLASHIRYRRLHNYCDGGGGGGGGGGQNANKM